MKMRSSYITVFGLALTFCLANCTDSVGATFYLAPNGNDTNLGTSWDKAWATLKRCQSTLASGDTVLIKNGNYGDFKPSSAPANTDWITYKAADGNSDVVFSCFYVWKSSPVNYYHRFEGITFNKAAYAGTETRHICVVGINNVYFKNCIIRGTGWTRGDGTTGIYVASDNVTLDGCIIDGQDTSLDCSFSTGFDVGELANNFTVTRCDIRGTWRNQLWGTNSTVTYNKIHDGYQDGLYVAGNDNGTGQQLLIAYNHIYNFFTNPQGDHTDLIQFSQTGSLIKNVIIRGNICHNTDHQAFWLNPPVGSGPALIENNLVYNTWMAGGAGNELLIGNLSSNGPLIIRNNIFDVSMWLANYKNHYDQITGNIIKNFNLDFDGEYPGTTGPVTCDLENYNIIYKWGTYADSHVRGANTITLNSQSEFEALFNNYGQGDYTPAAGAASVGRVPLNMAPSIDISENTRSDPTEVGCYEYTGSQPPVGNQPPNANAGPNQTIADSDKNGIEQVTLNGADSNDPNGSITSYVWTEDINGVQTVLSRDVNTTISLPLGRHDIRLTVTDNNNATDYDTVTVTIAIENGLIKYFKFGEGSGTPAGDSTGIGAAGLLVNGPLWTAQGEISFDGNNDTVEIPTADINASEGTLTLWAYPDTFTKSRHYIFGHATQLWNNRIQLYCNASGVLGLGLGNNSSLNTNIQTLNTHQWYHIALVWDRGNYTVYVDEAQKAAGTYRGLSSLQTYADIGNNGSRSGRTEGFDGLIDEVRLYDKSLTADEIANIALGFLPIGDKTVAEGEELRFAIRTKSGVIAELSDSNLPDVPSLVSNIFSWTPDYDDAGTYQVEFTSPRSDGVDFEVITITVTDTQQETAIGYWTFDETSGDIANDSSGSGNTGYLRNGLTWDSGIINGAVAFSVPNDAVEIRTTGFNTASGTIAMWIYPERQTLARHYLFGHATETLANRIQIYLKYGSLCLGLGDSHEKSMNIQRLQNQQWYHITLTWSGTSYNVYVDGLLMASGTFSGLAGFSANAEIGNNGISRDKAFNGKIDEVRIYNRALTSAEIAQLAD